MRNWKAILWIIALLCGSVWTGHAQRTITAKQDTVISSDSAVTAVVPGETAKADSTVKAVLSAADSLPQPKVKLKELQTRYLTKRCCMPWCRVWDRYITEV